MKNTKLSSNIKKIIVIFLPLFIIWILLSFKKFTGDNAIGTDTSGYYESFCNLAGVNPFLMLTHSYGNYEIGFSFLMALFNLLPFGTFANFILFSTFIYGFVCFAFGFLIYKKSNIPSLSIIIFICLFVSFGFSAMRQIIAIAVIALAIIALDKLKLINFILYFVIAFVACFFHESAIVAFIFPILIRVKPSSKNAYIFIISSFIFFIIVPQLYQFIIYHIVSSTYYPMDAGNGTFFFVYFVIILILIFIKYTNLTEFIERFLFKNIKKDEWSFDQSKNDYFLLLFPLLFFQAFSIVGMAFVRYVYYYYLFFIIVIPYEISKISFKRTKKITTYFYISVFLFSYLIQNGITDGMNIWPYRFFFID